MFPFENNKVSMGANKPWKLWDKASGVVTKDKRLWAGRIVGAGAVLVAGACNVFEPITTNPSDIVRYNIPPIVEMVGVWAAAALITNWAINLWTNPEDPKKKARAEKLHQPYRKSRGKRLVKGLVVGAAVIGCVKFIADKGGLPSDTHVAIAAGKMDRAVGGMTHAIIKSFGGHTSEEYLVHRKYAPYRVESEKDVQTPADSVALTFKKANEAPARGPDRSVVTSPSQNTPR